MIASLSYKNRVISIARVCWIVTVKSAIHFIKNLVYRVSRKYIQIRYHFIISILEDKVLSIENIQVSQNWLKYWERLFLLRNCSYVQLQLDFSIWGLRSCCRAVVDLGLVYKWGIIKLWSLIIILTLHGFYKDYTDFTYVVSVTLKVVWRFYICNFGYPSFRYK